MSFFYIILHHIPQDNATRYRIKRISNAPAVVLPESWNCC
ncbi:hypothetical protein MITSMUL_04586 [Mitsuokella multacida DSM 20544]|uniref:Uncharacterized protein n=1 Tax=Mitsuokella multacida DSM 20544 TaxID=500635 RepID=C9KN98_9FIRM|nr:hypothetical protein MITSMUL_04586 [Mitsuokella multacida DSM 20544]